MTSGEILQALYDSEINFRISCFWDGGFIVELGDEHNGFPDHMLGGVASEYGFDESVRVLAALAIGKFPNSKFAAKYKGE